MMYDGVRHLVLIVCGAGLGLTLLYLSVIVAGVGWLRIRRWAREEEEARRRGLPPP